jgi:hypothetical protein
MLFLEMGRRADITMFNLKETIWQRTKKQKRKMILVGKGMSRWG